MSDTERFEVVVVAYKSRLPLTDFLDALGSATPVVVVDNSAGLDDLRDLTEGLPNVRVIDAGGNLGFSAAANLGAKHSRSDYLVFMNPDTLPTARALSEMVTTLDRRADLASCGAAGVGTAGGGAQPTVLRTLVHATGLHRLLPTAGIYFYPRASDDRLVGWVSGSCLAIRRSDFIAVGGFDEDYFVFMSDFELGRKLSDSGRLQILLGGVTVPHVDGGSSDIPAQWTWSQRGKGWAQFLHRTRPEGRARLIGAILIAGYAARRGMYVTLRRSNKASEMASYVRSFMSEWHAPDGGGNRSAAAVDRRDA